MATAGRLHARQLTIVEVVVIITSRLLNPANSGHAATPSILLIPYQQDMSSCIGQPPRGLVSWKKLAGAILQSAHTVEHGLQFEQGAGILLQLETYYVAAFCSQQSGASGPGEIFQDHLCHHRRGRLPVKRQRHRQPRPEGCHRPSGGGGGGGEGGLDGCVSKRKAEKEDGPSQKEAAAVVIREQNQGADAKTDEVVWDDGNDYDSDDDVETVIAKVKARFDAFIERNKQWLWYRGDFPNEGHSVHDADGGGAVVVHGV